MRIRSRGPHDPAGRQPRRRPATPDRMRANGGTCASPREMPIRDGMIHAGEMPIRDDPAWEIKKKSV
jgi:hypothetical protein